MISTTCSIMLFTTNNGRTVYTFKMLNESYRYIQREPTPLATMFSTTVNEIM